MQAASSHSYLSSLSSRSCHSSQVGAGSCPGYRPLHLVTPPLNALQSQRFQQNDVRALWADSNTPPSLQGAIPQSWRATQYALSSSPLPPHRPSLYLWHQGAILGFMYPRTPFSM